MVSRRRTRLPTASGSGSRSRSQRTKAPSIEPTPFQTQVLAVPEGCDLFLGGGRGGGKSYGLLLLALRHAEQYRENARVLIVRRDFPSLRDLEAEARHLFRQAYGKRLGHNQQDHSFKFPNGALVRFDQIESAAEFHKFQGQSFSLIIVEEAGQYPDPAPLDMLRSSLRSKAGVPCRMVLAANPGGPGHSWILKRHIAGISPWQPYPEGASERVFVTAPSTLRDNPHLPTDYRKQIQAATATDPELKKAWLSGDWFIERGGFFSTVFDSSRNLVPAWPHLPEGGALEGLAPWQKRNLVNNARFTGSEAVFGWRTYIALDHGSAAPCVAYLIAVSPGAEGPDGNWYPRDSLSLFDEVAFVSSANLNEGLQMTIPAMAEEIRERCKAWGIRAHGVGDDACFAKHGSQQGTLADEYRKAGVVLRPAKKGDRLSGWELMRRLLADAGKEDKAGLYISERCSYWLQTVPTLPRDPRRPEDLDSRSADHAADATRYGVLAEGGNRVYEQKIKGLV